MMQRGTRETMSGFMKRIGCFN